METLRLDTTATGIVARLEHEPPGTAPGTTRLRWSNAGHPPPMAIDERGQVSTLAPGEPDLLLGLDPDTRRAETEVLLQRGTTLLLYTDGLVERRGQPLDEGLDRLHDLLGELAARDLGLDELCDAVLDAMLTDRPEDDVALVAVRLQG
jgi:serine phosphatase RsbU (regulator of sigma subunit)